MTGTLFMIHGMWAGPWIWDDYRRYFDARGYRCIAATLPYHERTLAQSPDARLGTTSLLDYVAALEREILALEEKPILVAHSMGGLLAQMLAARGLCTAAVLLAPAPPAGVFALKWSVIRSFRKLLLVPAFWRKPIPTTLEDSAYSSLHLVPPPQQRDIVSRMNWESGRAIFEIGLWPFDAKHAAAVDAAKVHCPLLIVGAEEDRIVPAAVVRQVAKKYGMLATYKEFPRHAHWLVGEPGWEDVADFVGDWLKAS